MEKLSLSSTSSPTLPRPFLSPPLPVTRAWRKLSFSPISNPKKFAVFASTDEDSSKKLDQWDLMELKFGRMIGEDPKLTMAKIMGRKLNPDASYLEIEKKFYKNKGKMVEVKEVPFEVPEKLGAMRVKNGLNLVKPVPKKGIKVGDGEDTSNLPEIKRADGSSRKKDTSNLPEIKRPDNSSIKKVGTVTKSNVPNVILRKPAVYNEKDGEMESSYRLSIKPNLSLSMRTEPVQEKFGGMTLFRRPEPIKMAEGHGDENENNLMNGSAYSGPTKGEAKDFESGLTSGQQDVTNYDGMMFQKPKASVHRSIEETSHVIGPNGMAGIVGDFVDPESRIDLVSKQDDQGEGSQSGMQYLEQSAGLSASESSVESLLLGRPKRLDQSMKVTPSPIRERDVSIEYERFDGESEEGSESFDGENEEDKWLLSRALTDIEETDWKRVEEHLNAGHRVEVELSSASLKGFVVSFGSLIGFLPYRNLAPKRRFLSFASWLEKNGLSPSKYMQKLGIVGYGEFPNPSIPLESSSPAGINQKADLDRTTDMDLEDLLRIYDQEKIQYLSSFIGQHIKVNISSADKKSRKLVFSMKPKEKEEFVEKKRSLMAKLSVGDVVKCCIMKITYFGIFVEVEGVPAMIHQSEVSWDATLDPASYLKTGQIVEAKVCHLDFTLARIYLSLKEISPDPLNEALECIGGNSSFNAGVEAAQADSEWPEVDSLIKALKEIDGIQTVNKGRFFLSPGLAPTFQVYMASLFEDQYKLLARSANKVQEVIVRTSLGEEEMKSAILKCTNRVEP